MDLRVEPARPEDWPAIRRLCCVTADDGRGVAEERWPFFAEYWIGPYQRWLADWTLVARESGEVRGYLTGCPDTSALTRRRALLHWPPLFLKAAAGAYGDTEDTRLFLGRAKGLASVPRPPAEVWRRVLDQYPAHLHVNVDERLRGQGAGAALVSAYEDRLRAAGVRGLHLVCKDAPLGFYERLGYSQAAGYSGLHLLVKTL